MTSLIKQSTYAELPALELRTPNGSQASILLQGAQIVSWIPTDGHERLYLSPQAVFAPGQAVRGGVPVVFPQFSQMGSLIKHGFARLLSWECVGNRSGKDYALVTLRLSETLASLDLWPHPFVAELTLCLSDTRLDIELEIENTGSQNFEFRCALHTYLRVDEVENIQLEGLRGRRYFDSVKQVEKVDSGVELRIHEETDRIYYDVSRPLLLRAGQGRLGSLGIHTDMPDVVVWNPWQDKCAQLTDIPDADFRRMLCVEAACVQQPVSLPGGQSWSGRQSLVLL